MLELEGHARRTWSAVILERPSACCVTCHSASRRSPSPAPAPCAVSRMVAILAKTAFRPGPSDAPCFRCGFSSLLAETAAAAAPRMGTALDAFRVPLTALSLRVRSLRERNRSLPVLHGRTAAGPTAGWAGNFFGSCGSLRRRLLTCLRVTSSSSYDAIERGGQGTSEIPKPWMGEIQGCVFVSRAYGIT